MDNEVAFRELMQQTVNRQATSTKSPVISEEKYNAIMCHLQDPSKKVDPHFRHWVKTRKFQIVDFPDLGLYQVLVIPNEQKNQADGSVKFLRVVHAGNVYDIVKGIHEDELKHSGYKKVMDFVQRQYYGITRGFIQDYCKHCPVCQLNQPQASRTPFQNIIHKNFLERVQANLIGTRQSPDREDYNYIGHFMDQNDILLPIKKIKLEANADAEVKSENCSEEEHVSGDVKEHGENTQYETYDAVKIEYDCVDQEDNETHGQDDPFRNDSESKEETWEEEEMAMQPTQNRLVGGQGVNPRLPLTTHPTPTQLGRRFITTSKRKGENEKGVGDSGILAEEGEASNHVAMSNRSRGINLTIKQEHNLVNWFEEHEIFYNKKLMDYKDTVKKAHLLEEKATELNLHINQLKTWYDGMRTRFARISSTCSGQEAVLDELTERDRWIYNSFQFLLPHIVRVPSRQSKTFRREDQTTQPSMSLILDDEASQDICTQPVMPSMNTTSFTATVGETQQELLEKLSQQYQQIAALQNRLMSTLQPQSTHMRQVTHFMTFLGSLCETMTPTAWKSFMVKAHQLALDHTPLSAESPPPQ